MSDPNPPPGQGYVPFHHKPWWHPLAYISRILPRAMSRLIADLQLPPQVRVLDYGCAAMPYRELFAREATYVGADLPGRPYASVQILPDGRVPADDASFDVVLSSQVLEHVGDPALYLAECFRVLRPGGHLILSTHGIMRYHTVPVDYWRWTAEGLKRVIGLSGFRVQRQQGIIGLAPAGVQLFVDATFRHVPRFLRLPYVLILQWLIVLLDRLHSQRSRDINSMVIAVVAQKPEAGAG